MVDNDNDLTYVKWDPISKRYVTVMREDRVWRNIGQAKYRKEIAKSRARDKAMGVYIGSQIGDPAKHTRRLNGRRRLTGTSRMAQVKRISDRDGWDCHWCEKMLSLSVGSPEFDNEYAAYPTIDHLLEKSKGGTNEDANCVLACAACNNSRSNVP